MKLVLQAMALTCVLIIIGGCSENLLVNPEPTDSGSMTTRVEILPGEVSQNSHDSEEAVLDSTEVEVNPKDKKKAATAADTDVSRTIITTIGDMRIRWR